LLSIIITVFATIGALILLSVVLWLLKWWGKTMRAGGWEIVVEEDGRVREGTWRRGSWWPRWMVARR
jgi:protein-S-isoprenylcysteine O-methyltransferase Ste14